MQRICANSSSRSEAVIRSGGVQFGGWEGMLMKTVCDGVDEQEMPRKMQNTSKFNGLRKRSKL
jgi:hypothetical protein